MRDLLQTSDLFYAVWLMFAFFGVACAIGIGGFIVYLGTHEKAQKAGQK